MTKKEFRTNIYVLDNDIWAWTKYKSDTLGYSTISEYIFDLLKKEKENSSLGKSILIELEKYFELNHYTLGTVAEKAGVPVLVINNFFLENDFSINNKWESIEKIHAFFHKNRILSRELLNAENLFNQFKYNESLITREILSALFPDYWEKRNEIFSIAFDIMKEMIEDPEIIDVCLECANEKCNYDLENINRRLYDLGINPEQEDDILDNPLFDLLKEKGAQNFYIMAFDVSSEILLNRELNYILKYFSENIIKVDEIIVNKIEERIGEGEERFEEIIHHLKDDEKELLKKKYKDQIPPR